MKLTRQIEAIGGDWIGACCSAVPSTDSPGKVTINRNGLVLKRVPKASRIQAAKALTEALEQVEIKNSLTAWQCLFDFARQCLSKPSRGGKKSKSLATVVNKQIKDFAEHKLAEKNASQNTSNNRKKSKHSSTEGQLISSMVSSKLGIGDVKGAVRILSSDATLLDCTPEIVEKLKSKHPDLHKDSNFPAAPTESESLKSLTVSVEDAKRCISSFKNGCSDGLAPQHLKDITSDALGETSKHLLQTMVKFLNGIVQCGNIPDTVQSSFFGASLIALSKKDGGVTPIAVGNTSRRLAGKACMFKVSCNLTDEFQPHQMGVCIPSGSEVAVHACRNFIRFEDSNSILLKIDFKNAFNTVKRDAILHKVKELLPKIFPFVFQAYAQPTDLFFGKESLLPKEGVQQGDPLGPLLFSLAIQDLISDCDSKFNMW